MIAVFGHDEYSVLGVTAILDLEKIPYRRVAAIDEPYGDLLIAIGSDLSPADSVRYQRRPSLVLNGGAAFARELLGAAAAAVSNVACSLACNEPVWPTDVQEAARAFGTPALRIPLVPLCTTESIRRGALLASVSMPRQPAGGAYPAVARLNGCVWSALDLGAAFANLITENYSPIHAPRGGAPTVPSAFRAAAERAYYAAPEGVRRWVQRRYYARLERQLESSADHASSYPVDATGWLLIELLKALIKLSARFLVRLERWPDPMVSAAALTHDIEPREYAYTEGIDRLLARLATAGRSSTVGLVAAPSARYLREETVQRLETHHVLCHGREHTGENVYGRKAVTASVDAARTQLERRLRRRVSGYRSPRLDRSPDLLWALDYLGFDYDSSCPDVDRENITHFGGGVRLNVPYRPLIANGDRAWRPSNCLELPLTAPDCIQPLFAGHSTVLLESAVQAKAAFVRATHGLYVALVHAGVFGPADAERREQHLRFVIDQLSEPGVWLTSLEEIARWWRRREGLSVEVRRADIEIRNRGREAVDRVRLVIEDLNGETAVAVPRLAAGAGTVLPRPHGAARPAA